MNQKSRFRGQPGPLDPKVAETRQVAPGIDAVPAAIRRAVLEKQLENYNVQAAEHFGAYEVNLIINKGNPRAAQQAFGLMNQALAAAARVKELIGELPVEVKQ
jgi:hypothetical protein